MQKLQKGESRFFLAPQPVFKHFHMLDKSCELFTVIRKMCGPSSDSGKPNFSILSKIRKKLNCLQSF